MIGITYTNGQGEVTKLTAESAKEAMDKLNSIKGYKGNIVDSAVVEAAKKGVSK